MALIVNYLLTGAAGLHGLSVSTAGSGGFGEDGQPETPAAAATATENEQVRTASFAQVTNMYSLLPAACVLSSFVLSEASTDCGSGALQGGVDLNIDLSVLKLASERKSLASQLLGPYWQLSSCAHAKPPQLASRKTLTLADYKRRQGIA